MTSEKKIEQPNLAQNDSSVLDMAFVMDCTGSMGRYINSATESIRKIVEEIVNTEKSNVMLALVEYRDHPPQESSFVTRVHDFTSSVAKMREWLEECSAQGGGDGPEAVADGLNEALNLSWRQKSTKICILISDAPPHGIGSSGDTMPNGCPKGIDPIKVVDNLVKKSITLYTIGCEPSILPYKDFFAAMAFKTGGQYVPLRNAQLLAKVIVGGAVEEISLERLMADVEVEVREQVQLGVIDKQALTKAVYSKLSSKGVKTNRIILNESKLEGASKNAKKYSTIEDLNEFREQYAPKYEKSCMGESTMVDLCIEELGDGLDDGLDDAPISSKSNHQESYEIASGDIDISQSERLVQKALNRKK